MDAGGRARGVDPVQGGRQRRRLRAHRREQAGAALAALARADAPRALHAREARRRLQEGGRGAAGGVPRSQPPQRHFPPCRRHGARQCARLRGGRRQVAHRALSELQHERHRAAPRRPGRRLSADVAAAVLRQGEDAPGPLFVRVDRAGRQQQGRGGARRAREGLPRAREACLRRRAPPPCRDALPRPRDAEGPLLRQGQGGRGVRRPVGAV